MKTAMTTSYGYALRPERVDRQALRFVLLTVAAMTGCVGLYTAIIARAVGVL
jgi:hypothetical protein